ncbi:MAG: serine hydrolase domain-containing protein [Rhodothermales bacterium]|nr:serine hydrolase domain-containing protein [Rhodothermales bacterium]
MRKLAVPARAITPFLLLLGPSISCSGEGNRTQATDAPAIFDPRFREVRDFIVQEVADGNVPSLAIAVAHNGAVVWEQAFGLADKENGIRASPNTMYRLGSISKPITATAVMRLVEAGRVDLDKPIEDYLGGLGLRYYVGTPEEVTVRRVLQHRAGLPPHNQIFFLDEHPERRPFDETVRRYGNVMFQPGWSFIYSNLGYQLLARLIEEVTGMALPEYARDSVFTPLGMVTAQVYVGDELRGPAAQSYYGVNGKPVPQNLHAYTGAADVYCSAHDLLRFAMFHLKNRLPDQAPLLADSTIDAMQRSDPPSNTRYGLGWSFDVDELGFRSVHHGGQTTGVSNLMALVPSKNLAYVILSNTDYEASKLLRIHDGIRAALIAEYRDAEPDRAEHEPDESEEQAPEAVPSRTFPEELLGRWEGRIVAYDREIGVSLVISNDDGAKIKLSGQEQRSVEFSVVSSGFLFGTFQGGIPTPDIARYEHSVRLALVRTGNQLAGQATAVGWREDRQTDSELSSWIELERK